MISVVTTCKNRLEYLSESLPSYVALDVVSEVIVVDFDSDIPLSHSAELSRLSDKVKILRVENRPTWKIGLAQNIGLSFVSNDIFIKVDSDVSILSLDSYVKRIAKGELDYIRGMHAKGTSSGMIMSKKSIYEKVGGYNDWLFGWGYDDGDFYNRLNKAGFSRHDFFKQEDFTEVKQHMSVKNSNSKRLISQLLSEDYAESTNHNFTSMRNYILANIYRQSENRRLTFSYEHVSGGLYNVLVQGLDAVQEDVMPMIDIANIMAAGLVSDGINILNIGDKKKHLDRLLAECSV